jgi:hypothetical protein
MGGGAPQRETDTAVISMAKTTLKGASYDSPT